MLEMVLPPAQQPAARDFAFFDDGILSPRSVVSSRSNVQNISNITVTPSIPRMQPNAAAPENLELAARLVDICQQCDFSVNNDLKFRLGLNPARLLEQPTQSGLNDFDYPNLETFGLKDIREFVPVSPTRIQPLPQELSDQFSRMQCTCAMGLFPEIGRAWVAVDSDLFVWNFETNDLAYFDKVPNVILLIGLVRPKVTVFRPGTAPPYLLCIVTSVEVLFFAVNFTDSDGQSVAEDYRRAEMHLMPEPLYRLPLDGADIRDIVSTPSGRIFLCSRDCCLYEIDYQPEGLLFGKTCKKINHSKGMMSFLVPSFVSYAFGKNEPLVQLIIDESRHILYTRSENGSIQAFDLGVDGLQSASKIAALSANEIQYTASQIAQTVEASNFKPIVFICPVTATESSCVNLIGITQSGVRLYFTCFYTDPAMITSLSTPSPAASMNQRPSTLRLVHVRLPPGFSANSPVNRPQRVHFGYFKRDLVAFSDASDEETDALWCLSGAEFGFPQGLIETQVGAPIRGRTWAIAEIEHSGGIGLDFFGVWHKQTAANSCFPPTIVTQHMEMPRRLVVMTAQGIHLFERLRPLDILRLLLLESGPDSHQTRGFFELHHPNQACVMCVALACSTSFQNSQVSDKAIRALYAFGGEPLAMANTRGRFDQAATPYGSRPFFAIAQQQPQRQISQALPGDTNLKTSMLDVTGFGSHQGGLASNMPSNEVIFSSRHNGLYGYFARIIGPLWNGRMISDKTALSPSGKLMSQVDCALAISELQWINDQLDRFLEFLNKEIVMIKGASRGGQADISMASTMALSSGATAEAVAVQARQQGARRIQAEAATAERQSLLRLVDLVQRCREILGLWRILSDHQVHVVLSFLPKDLLDTLKTATLRNLVVGGKELCADIITCIISTYLGDSAATDAISERLKKACPTLFTSDDATAAKASEVLQHARSTDDAPTRSKMINEALNLYKRVANSIHLPTVCLQLEEVECYDGIVDLALCAAQKLDPHNAALHYLKVLGSSATPLANMGDENSEFRQIFVVRKCCYRCVTDALNHLLTALTTRQHPKLTPQAAQAWIDTMLKMVFESDDELFHYSVFEWMMENRLENQLLQVPSSYVENYLHQCICMAAPREAVLYLNLLWKYYEKNGRFMEAAQLLVKLAERHSTDLPLNDRIAHLSRAVVCAKAATAGSTQQAELLHDAEDKLEVARLQAQIVDALEQLRQARGYVRDAITKLNAELMDVTTLYSEFAEEFNLPECKLAIIHCAGHYDPILVETLWKEIVDKELAMSASESSTVRSKLLTKKLALLAMPYIKSPRYFPAEFLRKYLLAKSNETGMDIEMIQQFLATYCRL